MAEKQSNQQRVNELARKKGARVERFTGYLVHTPEGLIKTDTLDEAEIVLNSLQDVKK
jgi:hypothetical protein